MFIQSVGIINYNNVILNKNNSSIYFNFTQFEQNSDKFELSFGGRSNTIQLDKAQHVSGIHCPACGVKMLSQEGFEDLVHEASNIKRPDEFITFLEKNKSYIPKNTRQIIQDSKNIPYYEHMTMEEYRKALYKISLEKKRSIVHGVRDYFNAYAQKLPESKQDAAKNLIADLHTKEPYNNYKEKVNKVIEMLDLDYNQTGQARKRALRDVILANNYFRTFHFNKEQNLTPEEISQSLVKRLFANSVNRINTIDKYPDNKDLPNNKVLICTDCQNSQSKNVFWHNTDNSELKDYIKWYLGDISKLMGNGTIDLTEDYITTFCYVTDKISRNNISFNDNEIRSFKNVASSAYRHETFFPIEQTEVDIPCAECGSIMLPHDKRKEIEQDMKKCSTPVEYAQVLQKYEKYIGSHAKGFARIFINITNQYPDISQKDFVKLFEQRASHYSKQSLKHAAQQYFDDRQFYVENFEKDRVKKYDLIGQKIKSFMHNKKYEDYQTQTLYKECFDGVDLHSEPVNGVFNFIRLFKVIAHRHLNMTKLEEPNFMTDKDPVYTILFNIFKFDVATADHLVPNSKGGAKSKDNLIGLCKICNRIKSEKDVDNWLKGNKRIEKNLARQMQIVDQMAKEGKIEGYDTWAKDIAEQIYELTYHRVDLRDVIKE